MNPTTFVRMRAGRILLEPYQGDRDVRFWEGFAEQCDDCGHPLDDPEDPAQYEEHGSVVICPACGGRYYVQNLGASCS